MNRSVVLRHVAVIGGYVFITLLMTWPAVTSLRSHVIGAGGDPWQTMWRFEETARLVAEHARTGTLWDFFAEEFFGGGSPRLVNLAVWLWLPLWWLVGLPAAYNVIWLLTFVLAGYGMYLFARDLNLVSPASRPSSSILVREAPAFLAGLYFMFLPFHVAQGLGHFGSMQLQWLPLVAWAAVRLYRTRQWGWAASLGLLVTVLAWSEHHLALWAGIFGVISGIWWRREVGSFLTAPRGKLVATGLAVWFFISVVLPYYPTIRLAGQGSDSLSLGTEQTVRFSSDLFSFVLPAPFHPLWGQIFYALFTNKLTGNVVEATQYLGIGALLLLLFFHGHIPRRQKFFWLLVGAVFLFIALGPYVHVFGHVLPLLLPYALVQGLPVLSAVRAVGRAGVMIGLASAVLLFWVLRTQLHRRQSVVAVAAVLLLDFLFFPVPRQSAVLSAVYQAVKSASGSRIIELPTATNYTAASRALFASHMHGKELLGDIGLERADTREIDLVRSVPGVRQLLYLRTTELRRDRSEFFAQSLAESLADALKYFDVGAIIIHTDSVSALQLSSARSFLEEDMRLAPQVVDDAIMYQVDPRRVPVASDGVFLTRDGRWSAVGYDPKRQSVFAEIETEAAITIVNGSETDKEVTLRWTVYASSPGGVRVKDENDRVISSVGVSEAAAVPIVVRPGKQTFVFAASGGKGIIQNPVMTVK